MISKDLKIYLDENENMETNVLKTEKHINDELINLSKKLNEVFLNEEVEIVKMNSAADLFSVDLLNLIEFKFNVQQLEFKAYEGQLTKQEVEILKDLSKPIGGKHVILIDGIIISGNTHDYLSRILLQRKPKSLSIVCIGTKDESKIASLPSIYSLFNFGNEWIEGYGIGNKRNSIHRRLVDMKKKS